MIERETMSGSVRILKNHLDANGPMFVVNIGVVDKKSWAAVLSAFWYYMEAGKAFTLIIIASQTIRDSVDVFLSETGMGQNARLFDSIGMLKDAEISEEIILDSGENAAYFKKSKKYVERTVSEIQKNLEQFFNGHQ